MPMHRAKFAVTLLHCSLEDSVLFLTRDGPHSSRFLLHVKHALCSHYCDMSTAFFLLNLNVDVPGPLFIGDTVDTIQ